MNSPTRDSGIERDFFTKGEDASEVGKECWKINAFLIHTVRVVVVVGGGCDINEEVNTFS